MFKIKNQEYIYKIWLKKTKNDVFGCVFLKNEKNPNQLVTKTQPIKKKQEMSYK